LFLPTGPASQHGAVLVLHACDGIHLHDEDWVAKVAGWGWVAMLLDSFGPRGVTTVCDAGSTPQLTVATRGADAFAAADYLRRRPDEALPDRGGGSQAERPRPPTKGRSL
jgi:dienelactone hydrolase